MSTIATLTSGETGANSLTDINNNFSALNTDKQEISNKSTTLSTDQASDTKYPSVKSVYDWATGLFATITNLALKAPLASPVFTGNVGIGVGADSSAVLDVHQVGNTIPMIQAQDGGTSSGSSGGIFQATLDNGTAPVNGTRIGGYQFSADLGDAVKRLGGAINALATETWTTIANGTQLKFNVTANGAVIRTLALLLNQDGSATFANTVNATTFVGALTGTASGNLVSGGALGTPSSATLTNATGLPIAGLVASTSTALGVGSIELGHASDTTLSRIAAGMLGVEGEVMNGFTSTATAAGTTTMDITYTKIQEWTGTTTQTVKLPTTGVVKGQQYIHQNTGTTGTSVVTVQSSGANTVLILGGGCTGIFTATQATPTTAAHWKFQKIGKNVITATSYTTDTGTSLNCDYWDTFIVSAQAGAIKLNNPTGTARLGQILKVSITGTAARAVTYDTQFLASTVALPSTTVTTAQLNLIFEWNGTSWVILGTS